MLTTVREVYGKQAYLRETMLFHARMHGGVPIAGLAPNAYTRPAVAIQVGEAVGLNIIENLCAAATAEVTSEKPKCTFATEGADWDLRQRAELLDKFCQGQFYQSQIYDIASDVFNDAAIFGTGILKIFEYPAKKITCERVFPWELYIDNADGMYRRPQQMFQSKYYDRQVLLDTYPGKEYYIKKAMNFPITTGKDAFTHDSVADLVQVVEGWRLGNPGRHVIAVDGGTLLDEEWVQPDFPFSFVRWLKRPFGFWGKGIAEQVAGIQKEINRLLLKIQRAFARLGITRIYLERGSKVNKAHLRAADGDIVEYTGQRPITEAPAVINPEIFNHLWQLERKAYEITGIAQMSAQGQAPPPGVDSGRAIRTLLQNHSRRMSVVHDEYADFFVDVAGKMIRLARDISKREDGYEVRFPQSDGGYETIDFRDINLEDDAYVIKRYPTSALPNNPGERLQTLQELFNSGLIDGDKFQLLADFPDLKAANDFNPTIASYKAIVAKLNDTVKKGIPWTPDAYVNLDQAKAILVPWILNSERDNIPEERLEMLRETLSEIVALQAQNAPPPPQGGGGPTLPQPQPGEIPGQVASMGQIPNPTQPAG